MTLPPVPFQKHKRGLTSYARWSASVACMCLAFPVLAQQGAAEAAANAGAPAAAAGEETVTEELIRMLQQHNALSKADAEELIGKLQAQKQRAASSVVAAPAAPAATAAVPPPANKQGQVRVIYVPESEKQKIRDEVKAEVVAQAKAENWAQPNALPEWTKRITIGGDFRFRYEFDHFDNTNDSQFINYQAINSGNPYDFNLGVSNNTLPPILNTTQDRAQPRIRGRLMLNAAVSDDLDAGVRLTTGNSKNPVSTDQTLGMDTDKNTFVVDQAYVNYRPVSGLDAWVGRMPNPWLSTDLVWDPDVNFDGVALRYQRTLPGGFTPFLTIGAFSVQNTDFDFPSTDTSKVASHNKWLYAGQLGSSWKVNDTLDARLGVAYYHFKNIQGRRSSPCQPLSATASCDTDDSRPSFIQKGNTLFLIRDLSLITDPSAAQFNYAGLASPFHEIDVTGKMDFDVWGPRHLVFTADFVDNLAYNYHSILAKSPINNYECSKYDVKGNCLVNTYHTGKQGFMLQMLLGYPQVSERWQWSLLGGYKRLASDAVVDAFTDSDFHFGGTNAKGYYLQGTLGFTHNAWLSARYLSADEVSGPPLSIDVLQLDLNARF